MLKKIILLLGFYLTAMSGGAYALEFSAPSLDGGTINLSDFQGRVVIVDFFASWCRPCRDAIPKLNRLLDQYANKGLSVVGYSVDAGGRIAIRPWVAQNRVNFPVAMGTAQEAKRIAQVSNLPTTIVISPDGRLVQKWEGVVGEDTLLATVRPYFIDNPIPQPSSARVYRRQPDDKRFRQVWSSDNEVFEGKRGVMLNIQVDVADMPVAQGAWLQINLSPEVQVGPNSLRSVGQVKTSYILVTHAAIDTYQAFIPCKDLPPIPEGGVLRGWMVLLDRYQQPVETSPEIIISKPCRR